MAWTLSIFPSCQRLLFCMFKYFVSSKQLLFVLSSSFFSFCISIFTPLVFTVLIVSFVSIILFLFISQVDFKSCTHKWISILVCHVMKYMLQFYTCIEFEFFLFKSINFKAYACMYLIHAYIYIYMLHCFQLYHIRLFTSF